MKKYHIYLTPEERKQIIESLILEKKHSYLGGQIYGLC